MSIDNDACIELDERRRSSLSDSELYKDVGRRCTDGDVILGTDDSPYRRDVAFCGEYVSSSSLLLDEPVKFTESKVFDRRYRVEGAAWIGGDTPTWCSKAPALEGECKDFDDSDGKCTRPDDDDPDAEGSDSTVIPVVLGDNGDGIMGTGIVRRFKYVRVF